jgi:hypothetical protein
LARRQSYAVGFWLGFWCRLLEPARSDLLARRADIMRGFLLRLCLVDGWHILGVRFYVGAFWMRYAAITSRVAAAKAKGSFMLINEFADNRLSANAANTAFIFKQFEAPCRREWLALRGAYVNYHAAALVKCRQFLPILIRCIAVSLTPNFAASFLFGSSDPKISSTAISSSFDVFISRPRRTRGATRRPRSIISATFSNCVPASK